MLRQLFSAVKFTITSPTTIAAAATRTMSTAPPPSPLKKPCKLALLQLASGQYSAIRSSNSTTSRA